MSSRDAAARRFVTRPEKQIERTAGCYYVSAVSTPNEDDSDDLDDDERAMLHAAIEEGLREAEAGDVVDAAEVIARLRARAS
jgi:hypothetical protein